uniref:tRNA synthetases class I (E and Q) anti-codon binding domain-containing protein n=1 Tax=Bionectria ochroleuca TaxID=29856 RepID=A0A8H7K5B1_BIOOC
MILKGKVKRPTATREEIAFGILDTWDCFIVPWMGNIFRASVCKAKDHGLTMVTGILDPEGQPFDPVAHIDLSKCNIRIDAQMTMDVNPKAYISWVPETSLKVEARIYRSLFKSNDPSAAEGGFLNDINPDSEIIYHNALLESGFNEVKQRAPWPAVLGDSVEVSGSESIRFQAIRVGYFAVDIDSTDEKIILNRIVSLKEDSGKNT